MSKKIAYETVYICLNCDSQVKGPNMRSYKKEVCIKLLNRALDRSNISERDQLAEVHIPLGVIHECENGDLSVAILQRWRATDVKDGVREDREKEERGKEKEEMKGEVKREESTGVPLKPEIKRSQRKQKPREGL